MRTRIRVLIILLMALAAAGAYPAEYHVNLDGTGDFTAIQDAIDASVDGDAVIVHPGTFYENIQFKGKNITLRSTEPTDWEVVETTVIDGAHQGRCVDIAGTTESCELSGFTITRGRVIGNGAGIYGGEDYGLGGAEASISHCIISNNEACRSVGGGGIYNCKGTISHCAIVDNSASDPPDDGYADGGGLCRCDAEITNCLIARNGGLYGGGLAICYGTIRNCIVADNAIPGSQGSGMICCYGDILNCIVWGNHSFYGFGTDQLYWCSTPTYSCVPDWTGGGEGNVSGDPLFVTGSLGDYYLSCKAAGQDRDSPCIDAGTGMAADYGLDDYTTRTDGVPDTGVVDMGFHYPTAEAQVDVEVSCSLNSDGFAAGDVLQGFMGVENRGADIVVDIFAVITMPDGSMISLTQNGFGVGIWPWYSDLILPSGFAAGPEKVFELVIPAGAAPGSYTYLAAISRAGAGSSGILSIDQRSFEIIAPPVRSDHHVGAER